MTQSWQTSERQGQQDRRAQSSRQQQSPSPSRSNPNPNPDEVRNLAYQLWEQAGRPEGQSDQFWMTAEQQLTRKR